MDLVDQMQTFVRIVETGSLSKAARDRRLSLPAVSRQLGALEADLGTPLVVRTTRRQQVTDAGRRWYEHCVRLLRELDLARADTTQRGVVGRVTISAPITLGQAFVVPRLAALAKQHAELEVDLRLEDHIVDLVGDAVDIAVRGGLAPPDSTSLIAQPLFTFRRVAMASPAYLRRRGTPKHPRDLDDHDALLQHHVGAAFTSWRFERIGSDPIERYDARPPGRLRSSAPIALRDWAVGGAGIALLPAWLLDDGLRPLLPDWQTPSIQIWALHRIEMRHAPRIRAVLGALAG